MKRTHIVRWLAGVLLLCMLAGCGKPAPEPAPAPTDAPTEPLVDDRTWAQRTVQTYAELSGISYDAYPENMLMLLDKNPEAIGFVLRYPEDHGKSYEIDMSEYAGSEDVPLFIQWDQRWGYIPYGADVAGVTACGPRRTASSTSSA